MPTKVAALWMCLHSATAFASVCATSADMQDLTEPCLSRGQYIQMVLHCTPEVHPSILFMPVKTGHQALTSSQLCTATPMMNTTKSPEMCAVEDSASSIEHATCPHAVPFLKPPSPETYGKDPYLQLSSSPCPCYNPFGARWVRLYLVRDVRNSRPTNASRTVGTRTVRAMAVQRDRGSICAPAAGIHQSSVCDGYRSSRTR